MHWLDFLKLPREEQVNMTAFYRLRNGDQKKVQARKTEILREQNREKARRLDARVTRG
jgi:hypothetical protein